MHLLVARRMRLLQGLLQLLVFQSLVPYLLQLPSLFVVAATAADGADGNGSPKREKHNNYLAALTVYQLAGHQNAGLLAYMLPTFEQPIETDTLEYGRRDEAHVGVWDLNGLDELYPYDINDYRNPVSVRRGLRFPNMTYEYVSEVLSQHNQTFCGVVKDIWACHGDHYFDVLREMPPFNKSSFTRTVHPGSVIVGDGNSYFAEMWAPVFCMPSVLLWKLDGYSSNSYAAYWPKKDVLILLIDNDQRFTFASQDRLRQFFERHGVTPTVLVLGVENHLNGTYAASSSVGECLSCVAGG